MYQAAKLNIFLIDILAKRYNKRHYLGLNSFQKLSKPLPQVLHKPILFYNLIHFVANT